MLLGKSLLLPLVAALLIAPDLVADEVAPKPDGTPQPKLEQTELTIRDITIQAEIADEESERQSGLMFREKLEPDSGMLFVFPRPEPLGFWMRNTIIPLSIAYINPDGIILEIHDMEPLDESTVDSKASNILYALEMDQGWFEEKGILPGERIEGLPGPSKE